MRMIKSRRATALLAVFFGASALAGCKEERPVIYSERVAVLPDRSGVLTKEIREIDKSRSELVICEVVGKESRDILIAPLTDFQDVRFRFQVSGDTLYLVHAEAKLESVIRSLGVPAFPVKTERVAGAAWLTAGLQEGDPLFYAPDKWGVLLELAKR